MLSIKVSDLSWFLLGDLKQVKALFYYPHIVTCFLHAEAIPDTRDDAELYAHQQPLLFQQDTVIAYTQYTLSFRVK